MAFYLPVSLDEEAHEIIKNVELGKRSAFVCEAVKEKGEREFLSEKGSLTLDALRAKHEKELNAIKEELEAQAAEQKKVLEGQAKVEEWKNGYVDLLNSGPEEDDLKAFQAKARKAGVLVEKKKAGAGFKVTAKLL